MASPWQRKVHHLSGPATVCSHSQPCRIDEGAVAVAGQCHEGPLAITARPKHVKRLHRKGFPFAFTTRYANHAFLAETGRNQPFDDSTLAQAADSLVRVSRRAANDPSSASIDLPSDVRSRCTQPPSSINKQINSSWRLAPRLRIVSLAENKRKPRRNAFHARHNHAKAPLKIGEKHPATDVASLTPAGRQ